MCIGSPSLRAFTAGFLGRAIDGAAVHTSSNAETRAGIVDRGGDKGPRPPFRRGSVP